MSGIGTQAPYVLAAPAHPPASVSVTKAPKRQLVNVQALRGVSVLLVILFHMYVMDRLYGKSQLFSNFFNFGSVGVDIFFVISGFIMIYISYEKFDDKGFVRTFIIHRLSRIVPLYWILTFLVFCFSLAYPTMINKQSGYKIDVVASFLFLPSDVLPLVPVGWSLNFEMYFYFVFAVLILFVPRRRIGSALAFWASAAVILSVFQPLSAFATSPWSGLLFSPFVLEFCGGCLIGLLFLAGKQHGGLHACIAAVVLFMLGAAFLQYKNPGEGYQTWDRVLVFSVPSSLLLYGMLSLEANNNTHAPKALIKIGDASYSLYLTHALVMHFVGKFIWVRFGDGGSISQSIIFAAINFLLAMGVGFLCFFYIERPLSYKARLFLELLFKIGQRGLLFLFHHFRRLAKKVGLS